MFRAATLPVLFALTLTGCGSTATESDETTENATKTSVVSSTAATPQQPKTLEAATASEQEYVDRYSSGDYAGQWLLYSSRLRDAISQDDYEAYEKRCAAETERPEGMRFTVEGVRMDGDLTAIVRIGLLGVEQSRTMVYEDGQWFQEPSDKLAANFGKPVAQWSC